MATGPALPLLPEPLSLRDLSDPLLVDPGTRLLRAVVETYREAAPTLVDPTVADLASVESTEGEEILPAGDLPTLKVLAGESAVDAATAGFRSASRLAALLDAGAVDLRVLDAPQPNSILASDETGFALIEDESDGAPASDSDSADADDATDRDRRWHRAGDDASLRGRYAPRLANAGPYHLRTPSRRRVYDGFASRCDEAVAAAVLRALDASADPNAAGTVGPTPEETRIRAYAVGAREAVLDRTLRRACEDAELGSPSTFTRIKRLLREAGLIDTEPEPQPVGRPRTRLVARGALASAETPEETVTAVIDVAD